jgi:uncharacterized protein (TIGR03118 family)
MQFRFTRRGAGAGSRRRPAADRPLQFRPNLLALENRDVPSSNMGTAYLETDLVSDQAGVAPLTDPNLVNPWGIAFSPANLTANPPSKGSPFWVSDNGTDKSTLYIGDSGTTPLSINTPLGSVSMPTGTNPTGIVFNGTPDFALPVGGKAAFIFASEAGKIVGWNGASGMTAQVTTAKPPDANPVYKGLALGTVGSANFLFVTDFHNGKIDVFDKNFAFVPPTSTTAFTDPNLPKGFAPFNIENFGGKLYVTYAKQNAAAHDDVAGKGNGFIDVYDTSGKLLQRLVSNGPLNSPWGMAMAPSSFGQFGGDLLVGNFGDGHINAFDPTTGKSLGELSSSRGHPVVIDGLWGLTFGNGGNAGDANSLYFTAGPDDESHGVFGKITANPAGTNPVKATFSGGVLTITGSPGDDHISVELTNKGQQVTVRADGQSIGPFDYAALSSIRINGLAGDDTIEISPRITVNAVIDGGAGNDRIKAGGGNDILLGGLGDDRLDAGSGRDILIGGAGADRLSGRSGDDLLIAGTTVYDTDLAKLNQILTEWTSSDSYNARVAALRTGITQTGTMVPKLDATSDTGVTVFNDDGARDDLFGGTGLDWFFADTNNDRIHGKLTAEQVN